MDSEDNLTTEKVCRHRKRKRRKWKDRGEASSNLMENGDSDSEAGNGSSNYWGAIPAWWYWSNYMKALDWQRKHKFAHWKSCVLADEQENSYSIDAIQNKLASGPILMPFNFDAAHKTARRTCVRADELKDLEIESTDLSNGEFDIEMSEEMMKFFEQSIRHKLEKKKLKEEESTLVNAEFDAEESNINEREREMKLLYGNGSCMIIGMETAVQLSFDKYCDLKSPKYWPNIPLKI